MAEVMEIQVVHLALHTRFDPTWNDFRRVYLSDGEVREGSVTLWIPVQHTASPPLLIGVYDEWESYGVPPFDDAILWSDWVVVGTGDRVSFVSPSGSRAVTFRPGGACTYFGHFYPYADFLLAASGEGLCRFDRKATLLWRTARLAVDGVIVHRVEDGVIHGHAEQDPPGGWEPFAISLDNGRIISSKN